MNTPKLPRNTLFHTAYKVGETWRCIVKDGAGFRVKEATPDGWQFRPVGQFDIEDLIVIRKATAKLRKRVEDLEHRKRQAYDERNRCVVAMAVMARKLGLDVVRAETTIPGWQKGEEGCVYINFKGFQASWHYKAAISNLFQQFKLAQEDPYDGHTTEQKYANLANLSDDHL